MSSRVKTVVGDSGTADHEKIEWAFTKTTMQSGNVLSPPVKADDATGGQGGSADISDDASSRDMENMHNFVWPEEVKIRGTMLKERKEGIRLMAAAQWRDRFFILWTPRPPYDKKNSLLIYFEDELSCMKYLRNQTGSGIMLLTSDGNKTVAGKKTGHRTKVKRGLDDLILGVIDLASLTYFQESYRLDLTYRAMELKTPRRSWVLEVKGSKDFYLWFHEIWKALILCNNRSVKMNLPNVWNYRMPGVLPYRICFVLFVLSGLWWLYQLLICGYPGIQPCVEKQSFLNRKYTCTDIDEYGEKIGYEFQTNKCKDVDMQDWWWYGAWNPYYQNYHCRLDVETYYPAKPPIYWFFVIAEFLNVAFASMFYLGLWRQTRRGTRFLDELNPPFPERYWPVVDILLCHYSEPAMDTMETIEAMLALEYPRDKLHIWVCDDGYTKVAYVPVEGSPGQVSPKISVNKNLIQDTGDVREELGALIMSRLQDNPATAASVATVKMQDWRKSHTTVILPQGPENRPRRPDGKLWRTDCSVGMVRDDYDAYVEVLPHIHYVARIKPPEHHAKAGNINNALYNTGAFGRYVCIFDNDMKPHPKFLKATLPLFYCKPGRMGGSVFDDDFTLANLKPRDRESIDFNKDNLDTPIIIPSTRPQYSADLGDDPPQAPEDLTLDEQIKLRNLAKQQADDIRRLKKQLYDDEATRRYAPTNRTIKPRAKKMFEAGPPEDLDGADVRTSSVMDEDYEDDGDTTYSATAARALDQDGGGDEEWM